MRIIGLSIGLLVLALVVYLLISQTKDSDEEVIAFSAEYENRKEQSTETASPNRNDFLIEDSGSLLLTEDEDPGPYIVDCTWQQFQEDGNLDDTEPEIPPESFEPLTEEEIQQAMEDQEIQMEEVRRQTKELIGAMSSDQSLDSRLSRLLIRLSKEGVATALAPNLDKSDEVGITSLRELVKDYPQSELAHNLLLYRCSTQPEECAESDELNATKVVGSNGHIWLQVALMRIAREDNDGVLEAIRQAAFASSFDEYWYQTAEQVRRSLPREHYEHEVQRIGYGIGVAASMLPMYQHLTSYCRAESSANASVASACLDLGERMEFDGKTYISNLMGQAIQGIVYEEAGDQESLERIERAKEEFEAQMSSELNSKAQTLMFHDLDLHEFWWREVGLLGEHGATESLVQEAIRLSAGPGYNPCLNSGGWF